MKIIISPAKTFKIRKIKNKNCDCLYESKKNELVSIIKEKSIEELKKIVEMFRQNSRGKLQPLSKFR